MVEVNQVYYCEVCGNMIEAVKGGAGKLVCCGKPMALMAENTTDAAKEKHVPLVVREGSKIKVSVGSVAHPMEDVHFIEWVEMLAEGRVTRKYLKPGMAPEVTFCAAPEAEVTIRAYCNKHGLWKA